MSESNERGSQDEMRGIGNNSITNMVYIKEPAQHFEMWGSC